MQFPELCYTDIALGGAMNRNNIVNVADIRALAETAPANSYVCLYRYGQELKDRGNVKFCKDSIKYCDYIYWDFDSKENLEIAWTETKIVCEKLKQMGIGYKVYFSGGKGFHIMAPASCFAAQPSKTISETIKGVAFELAEGMNTLDRGVYEPTRLFRIPNTQHKDTGLWKTQLDSTDLFIPAILELAKSRNGQGHAAISLEPAMNACILWAKHLPKVNQRTTEVPKVKPTGIRFAPVETDRNIALFDMIRKLKGISEADCLWIANKWNGDLKEPLPPEEILRTVQQAMKYGEPQKSLDVLTFSDMRKIYEEDLSKNYEGEKFGYSMIDDITGGLRKGEVFTIIARQGCFKTATAMNFMLNPIRNMQSSGLKVFFSFEMPPESVFERSLQILLQMKAQKNYARDVAGVRDIFRSKTKEWNEALDDMEKHTNDFVVYPQSGIGIEEIIAVCENCKEKFNRPISLVSVDYMGFVNAKGSEYERMSSIAMDFKTKVARGLSVPVVLISQTSRQATDGTSEVFANHAKGSGAIEDSADFAIGLWREELESFGPDAPLESEKVWGRFLKHRRNMAVKKYRLHPYFRLNIDGETMTIADFEHSNPPPKKKKERNY